MKQKVTLKQKTSLQESCQGENKNIITDPGGDNEKKTSMLWVCIVFAVLVVAIVLFFIVKGDNQSHDFVNNDVAVEIPQSVSQNEQDSSMTDTVSVVFDEKGVLSKHNQETNISNSAIHSKKKEPQQRSKNDTYGVNNVAISEKSGDVNIDALRAIRGEFGNGIQRKEALGDSYSEVQNRVNEIYREKGLLQ